MMSPSSSVQFSSNSVSVVKSVTLLNFKCAQLSKPEVTVSTNGEKKKSDEQTCVYLHDLTPGCISIQIVDLSFRTSHPVPSA